MAELHVAEFVERLLFAGLAILHLLPATGVIGSRYLQRLYGVMPATPDLAILLRHRALQFAVLGGLSTAAVCVPSLRAPVAIALAVSMLGFVLIARSESGGSASLRRVARIDGVALLPLAAWAIWKYVLA